MTSFYSSERCHSFTFFNGISVFSGSVAGSFLKDTHDLLFFILILLFICDKYFCIKYFLLSVPVIHHYRAHDWNHKHFNLIFDRDKHNADVKLKKCFDWMITCTVAGI